MGSKRLYRFATLFRMAVTRQMTRDDAAQILEVPPSASNDEVMSAWKRMAIQWHPDRNSDPQATSIMAKINMARDLMTGRQWRVMFDDGQTEPPPRPARSPGQDFWGDMWGAWPGGPGWDEDEEEPEESPAGENPTIDGNENWGRCYARIPLGEGAEMSVVGGPGNYSEPRQRLNYLNDYRELEMAIIGPEGENDFARIVNPIRILGENHPFSKWITSADDVMSHVPINVVKDLTGYTIEVIKNEGWNPGSEVRRPWRPSWEEDEEEEEETPPEPTEAYKKFGKSRIDGSFETPKTRRAAWGRYEASATFKMGNVTVKVRGGEGRQCKPQRALHNLNEYETLDILLTAGGVTIDPGNFLGTTQFDKYYDFSEECLAEVPVQDAKNFVAAVMDHMSTD